MNKKKKWELLSDAKPTKPGYYWVGVLEYPDEHGRRKGVYYKLLWIKASEIPFGMQSQCGFNAQHIVWFGPLDPPEMKKGELRRLILAQESHFVGTYYKHCEACGWTSGLNKRSIGYIGQREDCPECRWRNGDNTVAIKEKALDIAPAS